MEFFSPHRTLTRGEQRKRRNGSTSNAAGDDETVLPTMSAEELAAMNELARRLKNERVCNVRDLSRRKVAATMVRMKPAAAKPM